MDLLKIKQMVADGFACRSIATHYQISPEDMAQVIKDNDFTLERVIFTEDAIPTIKRLYSEGVSAKQLGLKFGIDKRRIQKWAKEDGFLRNKNESHRMFVFNEHIFDLIDTPEKAYWLGFLYADVYNYTDKRHFLRLHLKSTDINHLKKFCQFMNYDEKQIKHLSYTDKNTNKTYYSVRVTMNSIHLTDQLTKLGCMQAKSLIITYPDWLDESLHLHFIRGVFDGDGSLKSRDSKDNTTEWNWSIAGTKELVSKIKDLFYNQHDILLQLRHHAPDPATNTWVIESSGNLKVQQICALLFKDATVYLDRKHQQYQDLCKFNLARHPAMFAKFKFNDLVKINDQELDSTFIETLSITEKHQLIKPIATQLQHMGFIYPDSLQTVNSEYGRLFRHEPDLSTSVLDNNSRMGTTICRYFCHSYYHTRSREGTSVYDSFHNPDNLEYCIADRLGLKKWTCGNISVQSIVRALKDHRMCAQISIFKPHIAKYMCMKYSEPGDLVGDYSCGFGGRLLGAMSCGRRYIGTDPFTVPELRQMVEHFNWQDQAELIPLGSEFYRGKENSVDLYWSSPPYFDQEIYSDALTQAYAKGEYYFYYKYWLKTLDNVRFMLKPGKWFGLNISNKYPTMIELARQYFGDIQEVIQLKSRRDHFVKQKDKVECIYMFKNNKE